MPPKDIDGFVDWVLDQKPAMKDLEPDIRNQIKSDFVDLLGDQINAEILARMPEDKLDEFDTILSSKDGVAAQAFCQEHVPGMSEIVAQVLVDFKLKYVGA